MRPALLIPLAALATLPLSGRPGPQSTAAPAIESGPAPVTPSGFKPGTGPGLLEAGKVGADLITLRAGADPLGAYVAWPGGQGPFPALIVVHEWWGLNDWVKKQARDLAGHGYVAVAVDLYRGQVASDADAAHQLMRGLPQDRGVRYLRDAFAWIAKQRWAKADKIGVIGWCMGGGYAAQLAVAEPRLKAAVINYGALPDSPNQIRKIKAALLGNFGGLDQGIPLADARKFKAAFEKAGGKMELHEWPNSGHAFMNEGNSNHNVADAANAWFFIHQFLSKELGGLPGR